MSDTVLPAPVIDPSASRHRDLKGQIGGMVGKVTTREEARLVAQEFERMFLTEMLGPMFAGIQTDGPFGGGVAEDMFRPMLLDQYADAVARTGGVGIADSVMAEILRIQGLE